MSDHSSLNQVEKKGLNQENRAIIRCALLSQEMSQQKICEEIEKRATSK